MLGVLARTRRRRADLGELLGGGRKADARRKNRWFGLGWRRRRRGDVVRLGGVELTHRCRRVSSVVDSVVDAGAVPRLLAADDRLSRIKRWHVGVLGLTCGLSRDTFLSGVKKRSAWPREQAGEIASECFNFEIFKC